MVSPVSIIGPVGVRNLKRFGEWTLPVPPSLNRLYHNWRGRMVKSKEGKDYAKKLVSLMGEVVPVTETVELQIVVYRPRKIGDLDNYLKCFLDSLAGILYHNDKQIRHINAYLEDDKDDPRVELEMYVEIPRP